MVSGHLFANYADYYSEEIREWRRLGAIDKAANIIRLCSGIAHDSVIEIGCGEGAVMRELLSAKFCQTIVGFEISPSAQKMAHESGLDVRLFDGQHVPLKADLVVLSHVVEHLEHPRQLLYEAARLASQVFVEVPLEDNRTLRQDYAFDSIGHINFYSRKTARLLLQTCGLTIEQELITHSSSPVYEYRLGKRGRLNWILKTALVNLVPSLAPWIFTYHYSALASSQPR